MNIYRYRFWSGVVGTECPEREGAGSVDWVSSGDLLVRLFGCVLTCGKQQVSLFVVVLLLMST